MNEKVVPSSGISSSGNGLFHVSNAKNFSRRNGCRRMHIFQWWIQDFPEGFQLQRWDAKLLFGYLFPENCMKVKKMDPGHILGASPHPTPGSPNVFVHVSTGAGRSMTFTKLWAAT